MVCAVKSDAETFIRFFETQVMRAAEQAWEEALVEAYRFSGSGSTHEALRKADALNPYRPQGNGKDN